MKRYVFTYSIEEVAPFIDWSYFLHAWGITEENRQANEIISDAKAMLEELSGKHKTTAIFALCNAKSNEEDILIE